ncbi:MAG TPA: hypothetical protein VH413_16130 [Verrucomicrobiae bacterium]|jgi:hypothetical protein|nr:hypothetical protein [Verrucomicrobiae bacterium]
MNPTYTPGDFLQSYGRIRRLSRSPQMRRTQRKADQCFKNLCRIGHRKTIKARRRAVYWITEYSRWSEKQFNQK